MRLAVRDARRSAGPGAAALVLELYTPDAGRFGERSCADLAELAAHAPAARLQLAVPERRVWALLFALEPRAERLPVQLERTAVVQLAVVRLLMAERSPAAQARQVVSQAE